VPDFAARLAAFGSEVYRTPRPAQAHVLDTYGREHISTPDVAIELPTGEGKTLIALLIGDWALDEGRSVAYLTGTRQLAEQVEAQAHQLSGLVVHRFWGGNYPGAALDDYHQAQAIGVMNYWVYFNSRPRVAPADLVIFDDAHIAEQPLSGLFTLRIPRYDDVELYRALCDLVLAHTDAYANLRAMRDGAAPPSIPPELLAFNDWATVLDAAETTIERSASVNPNDGKLRWVWPALRGHLDRCGVLIGPSAIEIRPYHPPTQTIPGYAQSKQRIYLSATLGTMGDLQRRLGVRPVTPITVPAELQRANTGDRLLLLNPSESPGLAPEVLNVALEHARHAGRAAWLCASHAEADELQEALERVGRPVFRLWPGEDTAIEAWRQAPAGDLVAAGRFDGLDFADDTCRLVILPSIPAASTEFERFAVAYLGDATFMRHRIGQRVTQALGRANRSEDDWALYFGLDPGFAERLADPTVRAALAADVGPLVRRALELHGSGWPGLETAAAAFWQRRPLPEPTPAAGRQRPGRQVAGAHRADSAPAEVDTATALWLGDDGEAAEQARQAAQQLTDAGEPEHAAFWRYVEAHALYSRGRTTDVAMAKTALREAIANGPRTAWFVRLGRTLEELEGQSVDDTAQDDLFLAWDEWLREAGPSVSSQLTRARTQLQGTHDEQVEGLLVLARLCGAHADRPGGQSAADVRWTWVTPTKGQRRVWEVKTGTGPARVPREDINQVLGQLEEERQRSPRHQVLGVLVTPLAEMEPDAAAAAREKVAVLRTQAVLRLFDLLADRFRTYQARCSAGTASERGAARQAVEPQLPRKGWLKRLLAPSGHCRDRGEIEAEFAGAPAVT